MATSVYGDFEWDTDKATANLAKHGVDFEEAASVFASSDTQEGADLGDPTRLVTIGFSAAARVLLVVTTDTAVRTRIISARRATPAERRAFAKR